MDGRKVYFVDEDRWVTMNGTHVLVGDRGDIKNEKLKKKIEGTSKKESEEDKEKEAKKQETIKKYGGTDLTKSELNKKYGGELVSMDSNGEYNFKSPDVVSEFLEDVENKTDGGSYAGALNKEELGVLKALAYSDNSYIDAEDKMWIMDNFRRVIRAKLK